MKRQKSFGSALDAHRTVVRAASRMPADAQKFSRILVVISYYDARPLNNLLKLLQTIEFYDAGLKFDICVVVNRESGRTIELPQFGVPVTILSRPNSGMNIGAWDYGWRENPGYDYYVFLQDECVILRHGWLEGLVERLMDPGVGLVGECINRRWAKCWAALTSNDRDDSLGQVSNLIAHRATVCLEFMAARGIPAGETGHHVRSLVWAFSREVLLQLGGFPIGGDYDECIAAEISVSRRIESLGLSIQQAHRTPFFFVGHSQWINTYPGLCTSLRYADWAEKHFSDPSFVFPITGGHGDKAARALQLVKRAETERGLFDSRLLLAPRCGFLALLVVVVDEGPSYDDLATTVLSWSIQSAPYVDLVLLATDQFLFDKITAWKSDSSYEDFSETRLISLSDWKAQNLADYEYVAFARPGDQFHPSVTSMLAMTDESERPDIVVWNERRRNRFEQGARLVRQPELEPFTLRSVGYIGMAFAVCPDLIEKFPYDFIDDLLHNDSHLFHLWLAQDSTNVWKTHPEFLCSRISRQRQSDQSSRLLDHSTYRDLYREILKTDKEVAVFQSRHGQVRSALSPSRRPQLVSVIASFRDRPEETLACLRSILGQSTAARIEVILINNRSDDESLAKVREALESYGSRINIRLIEYDGPFNHSRQTNLGVRASSGEVLVFLNNDAEFMAADVLDEMCAWALFPGVGTVSCQIVNASLELVCAGIRAREEIPATHSSFVQESKETSYSGIIREVLANTFACAAIARSRFEQIGWLNEVEFPNGYNDVEYCLRTRKQGYRNLYLGHLQVKHTPGTSRGRCDETLQKILLRKRYPELSTDGIFHLSYEWRSEQSTHQRSMMAAVASDVYPSPVAAIAAGKEVSPVGLKEALRILYRASIWWVQRRILS